ncbi:MAG TPA: hypothetical protein VJS44_09530 [Pyrinomonadaceae bacterium]|nr:hypothetical protein [Pyrinomonadaceae bacterium]
MNANYRIKVVKRAELDSAHKSEAPQTTETRPNATKTVTRKVTAWVKEFQQRRVQEAGRSFDSLFQRA